MVLVVGIIMFVRLGAVECADVVEFADEEFGGVSWVKLAMVGVTTMLATGSFITTGDIPVVVGAGVAAGLPV